MFIYETFRQSCPGGGLTEFIIDDGSKLVNITSVSTVGEGGYFDLESAYIPLKFENNKILLVENADIENIPLNANNGEALCFYQSSSLVDSAVLRNRHLRKAAKRLPPSIKK
jgi:hypothetical protein